MSEQETTIICNQCTLRRPVLKDVNPRVEITYYNGEKWEKEMFWKSNKHRDPIAIAVAEMFNQNAFQNNGNITPEQIQELFVKFDNLIKGEDICKRELEFECARTKDLFQQYMLDDSDGGNNITQKEQFEIMSTVVDWFKFKLFYADDLNNTKIYQLFKNLTNRHN